MCHWEQQAQQPSRHTYLDYGAEHINSTQFLPLPQHLLQGLNMPLLIAQRIGITEDGVMLPRHLRRRRLIDKIAVE